MYWKPMLRIPPSTHLHSTTLLHLLSQVRLCRNSIREVGNPDPTTFEGVFKQLRKLSLNIPSLSKPASPTATDESPTRSRSLANMSCDVQVDLAP